MMKQVRKPRNILIYLASMVLILASLFLVFDIAKRQVANMALKGSLEEVQAELEDLQEENNLLVEQKEKLSDPEYVKNYARGRYMLSQDNEQIFRLPGRDE